MTGDQPGPILVPTGDIRPIIELGIALQEKASAHYIHNVFDDGGYKELLLLTLFGLTKLRREGDDAEDAQGRRYEIKTVARVDSTGKRKPSLQVTTEHTLTRANITRYRMTFLWIVAVFDQAHPEAIYEVAPAKLERYFTRWETTLKNQEKLRAPGSAPPHLNNRHIPLTFIERVGIKIWPPVDVSLPQPVQEALELTEQLEPGET
jgi:restriction endonuclease PvuII